MILFSGPDSLMFVCIWNSADTFLWMFPLKSIWSLADSDSVNIPNLIELSPKNVSIEIEREKK